MIYSNSATITTHGLHDSYHQPCGNGTEKCTIDFLLTYLDSISISTLIEYVVLQPSVLVSYTYTHTYIYIHVTITYIHIPVACAYSIYDWYFTDSPQDPQFFPAVLVPGGDMLEVMSRHREKNSKGLRARRVWNFRKSQRIVVSKHVIP
jgi:hypothetical protein